MAQTSMSVQGKRSGASPVRFGTILFLASELLFFGGLFAAYFALRAQTSPWPPAGVELDVLRSAVATALLLISSFTFHAVVSAAERGRLDRFRGWLLVTIALGTGFAVIQIYDYIRLNFEVSSSAYGTMYWAVTGMHGLHVVAGLILMIVVAMRVSWGAYRTGNIDGLHAAAEHTPVVQATLNVPFPTAWSDPVHTAHDHDADHLRLLPLRLRLHRVDRLGHRPRRVLAAGHFCHRQPSR